MINIPKIILFLIFNFNVRMFVGMFSFLTCHKEQKSTIRVWRVLQ
jgi:hypothetical protein